MFNKNNNNNSGKLPQHFRGFVEIFFAVVLGASVLEFHALLFPPDLINPSFWALTVIYFTAVTSWISWHKSTTTYPYTNSTAGHLRSVLDAVIVVIYAALLFSGSRVVNSFSFENGIDNSLGQYLWGFAVIFFLYFIVGEIRRAEYHREEASKIYLIVRHGSIVLVTAIAHTVLSTFYPNVVTQLPAVMWWLFLFLPLVTMVSFRWFRDWRELPWTVRTRRKYTIAVDMDGVLIEQVIPVLEKVNRERDLNLSKSDITDWEYPIDDTDIKIEIERAEQDEEFVKNMPIMESAKEALNTLSDKYNVIIATSRESNTGPWNKQWLDVHGIKYTKLVNTRSEGKVLANADILIDDYVGNTKVFLENGPPERQAILFAQPWNKDTSSISDFIASGRIQIAHSWDAILAILG